MDKWADFLISKVRYNAEGTRISKVLVHDDLGDTTENTREMDRAKVVAHLEDGKTFCTVTENANGKFTKGAKVHILPVDGEKFIRTDKNNTAEDNLGELEEL